MYYVVRTTFEIEVAASYSNFEKKMQVWVANESIHEIYQTLVLALAGLVIFVR